jgi:hypothetical protein
VKLLTVFPDPIIGEGMQRITLTVDDDVLHKVRQYAGEHNTTLEALLAQHLALLAGRTGRRLTLREQIYADHAPPRAVADALRAEAAAGNRKGR